MYHCCAEATISFLKNKIPLKMISNVQVPRKILMIFEVYADAKI